MFRHLFILLALWHWQVVSSSEQEDFELDCVVATSNKNYGDIPLQSMRPSSDKLRSSYQENGRSFVPFDSVGLNWCDRCVTLPGYTKTSLSIPAGTTYCEMAVYVTEAFHYLDLSLAREVTLESCDSEYLIIRDGNSLQKYCDKNQNIKITNGRDVVYITYESRKPLSTSLDFIVESKYPNISDSSLMKTATGKTIDIDFYMPKKDPQPETTPKEFQNLDSSGSNLDDDYALLEENLKDNKDIVDIAKFFTTELQNNENDTDTESTGGISESDVLSDEESPVFLPDISLDPLERDEQGSPEDRNRNVFQFCRLCGQVSVYTGLNKIVGGADSAEGEYPSHASVQVHWQNEEGQNVTTGCGGTILDSKNILTAAHCFPVKHNRNSPNVPLKVFSATVTVGDWRRSVEEGSEQIVPVQAYVPHYSYVLNYQKIIFVDIAVIHLLDHLTLGPKVFPTCIASNRSFANEIATVTGFGRIHPDGPGSDTLQEAMMTIKDDDYCRRNAIHFDDKAICIEEPNKDSCPGDSGGPAYIQSNNVLYQVGIVSASKGRCATPGDPTVFTKVPAMMPFLQEYTRKDGKCFN